MIKGYVMNIIRSLIICPSDWGIEAATPLKMQLNTGKMQHCLSLQTFLLFYHMRYLDVTSPQHTFDRDWNKLMVM